MGGRRRTRSARDVGGKRVRGTPPSATSARRTRSEEDGGLVERNVVGATPLACLPSRVETRQRATRREHRVCALTRFLLSNSEHRKSTGSSEPERVRCEKLTASRKNGPFSLFLFQKGSHRHVFRNGACFHGNGRNTKMMSSA